MLSHSLLRSRLSSEFEKRLAASYENGPTLPFVDAQRWITAPFLTCAHTLPLQAPHAARAGVLFGRGRCQGHTAATSARSMSTSRAGGLSSQWSPCRMHLVYCFERPGPLVSPSSSGSCRPAGASADYTRPVSVSLASLLCRR